MTTQQPAPLTHLDAIMLTNQQATALILTTQFPADIDYLETAYQGVLSGAVEIRDALFEVARQNAEYRRTQAPAEPLPVIDVYGLDVSQRLDLLKVTHDSQLVDIIKEITERRLRKFPEFRKGLFDIARLGISYRSAAHTEKVGS